MANVYQGDDARQLSMRSIVAGMIIGGVMAIANLYVGLKTGFGLPPMTIATCVMTYAVFRALERTIPAFRKTPFTILENYTMSSAATAAGYISSAGLASAIPALYLTTQRSPAWWEIMSWLAAVSALGVFMAIPLKRQFINVEALPFPMGTATAETLKAMYASSVEALQKARALFWSAVAGAGLAVWRDGYPPFVDWLGHHLLKEHVVTYLHTLAFPGSFPLYPGGAALQKRLTFGFEGSVIMVAAGAIIGIRMGVSLLIGAVVYFGVIGNQLVELGIVKSGTRGIVSWTIWPATAMMLTYGLLSFALRWRMVARAFGDLRAIFSKDKTNDDPIAHVEIPGSWFVAGIVVSGLACILLGHFRFGISWWMGMLALPVTFLLSIVVARARGETDLLPIGSVGKFMQMFSGWIVPSSVATNLMTASMAAGASVHSADLLTDLKAGYLLGANPRKQLISQLLGVLAGTLICVPVYAIIVRSEKLGTEAIPVPLAQAWADIAKLLSDGGGIFPTGALAATIIGALVGIILVLLEEVVPKPYRAWVPSAIGLGIAGVVSARTSISMFVGALAAWILYKASPKNNEKYTIAVASGLIAGESFMAVAIILWLDGSALIGELLSVLK